MQTRLNQTSLIDHYTLSWLDFSLVVADALSLALQKCGSLLVSLVDSVGCIADRTLELLQHTLSATLQSRDETKLTE
jgi:hypothetical protein